MDSLKTLRVFLTRKAKLALGGVVLLVPHTALAATAPTTLQGLVNLLVGILDSATLALMAFAVAAYFWGILSNMSHLADEKGAEKRKALFFWGLIVLFVMVSVWGILRVLQATLFGS